MHILRVYIHISYHLPDTKPNKQSVAGPDKFKDHSRKLDCQSEPAKSIIELHKQKY